MAAEFMEDDEFESSSDLMNVPLSPAQTTDDFNAKAKALLSNAMDVLNHKIVNGMAEASDIKTAVDIGKMFRIGIETVDEAAKRALAEATMYNDLADDDDADTVADDMRFEG